MSDATGKDEKATPAPSQSVETFPGKWGSDEAWWKHRVAVTDQCWHLKRSDPMQVCWPCDSDICSECGSYYYRRDMDEYTRTRICWLCWGVVQAARDLKRREKDQRGRREASLARLKEKA